MTHDQELDALIAKWRSRTKSHDKLGKAESNYQNRDRHTSCANVYETCADELEALQAAKREPVVTAQMMKQAADAWCEWFGCDNDDSQRPSGTFFLHILTKALTTPRGG